MGSEMCIRDRHWTFEVVVSCPHVAEVVVLVCPHSSTYFEVYSLMMSSYPFEMIGSWPHVAMVVVLVCSHFPSLEM